MKMSENDGEVLTILRTSVNTKNKEMRKKSCVRKKKK